MKTFICSSFRTGPALKVPLFLLLMVLPAFGKVQAQVVVQGFETQCTNPSNAFYTGCFPGWIATHGTPDNSSNYAGVSPYAGQKYMHGYVRYRGFYCSDSPIRGEGIALQYPFQAGVTYKITYAFRSSGTVLNREWILTNGLPNNTGGANGCPAGEVVPAIPPGSLTIHSPGNSSSWVVHSQTFTPSTNYGQLWFRVWNPVIPGQSPSSETIGDYYLDGFTLEIICDTNSVISAFHFEDENGNPKTSFCYGEDVYLNGTASQNETQYFIDLWRRPIGSTGAFSWVSGLGWTPNAQVGIINLTEAFANIGYYPLPGYEYQVKLAVANPPCVGWTQTLHEFTLNCCEGTFNPDFGLSYGDAPGGGPASLVAHSFNTYSSLNIPAVTHQWTVLASSNPDSGPYSLVSQITTTSQGTVVVYDQAQPGIYYTVIHKITTACGEVCFGKQRYGNSAMGEGENRSACEFCGPIDCSLLDEICFEITNLNYGYYSPFSSWLLAWNPVPGISEYTVEVIYGGDDECCGDPGIPPLYEINSTPFNWYFLSGGYSLNGYYCATFRVGYKCPGTEEMIWTDRVCLAPRFTSEDQPDVSLRSPSHTDAFIFPNPASDWVNLRFGESYTGQIQIADIAGRVRATHRVEDQLLVELPVNDLPAGIYWILLPQSTGQKAYKLVKQ